jgi:hypothetical protein
MNEDFDLCDTRFSEDAIAITDKKLSENASKEISLGF